MKYFCLICTICNYHTRGSFHWHGDSAHFLIHLGPRDPVRATAEITLKASIKVPDAAAPESAEIRKNPIKGTTEVT